MKMIEVNNVSMCFNMSSDKVSGLKEYILKLIKGELFYKEFWAIKDVSFTIKKGEVFGIVGLNGAGKSTMLKIIAGVLKPTEGGVKIYGNVAPLIELGAGFDHDLTGRENIYLNGAILGHTKKFINEKFDEIVEFSELNNFLDIPLKNYSSGMVARLGFAIATLIKPDILIVDEILGVGDYKFQEKCQNKIQSMLSGGTTVIMVSHSQSQIEDMCSRVLWLEGGKMKMIGEVKEVMKGYSN